jgi:hypothetical protein
MGADATTGVSYTLKIPQTMHKDQSNYSEINQLVTNVRAAITILTYT